MLQGTFISGYRIVRRLGQSGLNTVYLAERTTPGDRVAIKTVPVLVPSDPHQQLEMMSRELSSLRQLDHPNIVKAYETGIAGDIVFLVREYVEGTDLDELARSVRLTPSLVHEVLMQVARALDYTHTRKIVHRNIKLANILVSTEEAAKITGFSLAKVQPPGETTLMEPLVGTLSYMAPEQMASKGISGAADQYSLGVVAYQVLTGSMPFATDSPASLLRSVLTEKPAPPHTLNPSIGVLGSTALLRALEKSPDNRYPTCESFIQNLLDATDCLSGWRADPTNAGR